MIIFFYQNWSDKSTYVNNRDLLNKKNGDYVK